MATFQTPEGFQRLSDVVFIYTPGPNQDGVSASTIKETSADPPDLILLATWMGAAPRHTLKYTSTYKSLFPLAKIVLIVNSPSDIMLYSAAAQRERVEPAVKIIQSTISASSGRESRILLQSMSNGGAYQISTVAEVFKKAEGRPLPVNAIILDSSPGKDSILGSTRAILLGLPKSWIVQAIGAVVVCSMMVFSVVAQTVLWQDQLVTRVRKNLNDKTLFNPKAGRCYIYSKADDMVHWEDVKEHAEESKAMGWPNVEELRFKSSPHCGHIRGHEQEYWGAVLATWKTAAK